MVPTVPGPGESLEPLDADALPPLIAPGRTHRDYVARWIDLRGEGLQNKDIASKLGISPKHLATILGKATRAGWLKFDHPGDRLQHELSHIIVDNIEHHLKARDKRMTIEAAKGIGLFQSHQAVKIEGEAPTTVLALKFDALDGITEAAAIVGGNIVGKPKLAERTAKNDAITVEAVDVSE